MDANKHEGFSQEKAHGAQSVHQEKLYTSLADATQSSPSASRPTALKCALPPPPQIVPNHFIEYVWLWHLAVFLDDRPVQIVRAVAQCHLCQLHAHPDMLKAVKGYPVTGEIFL